MATWKIQIIPRRDLTTPRVVGGVTLWPSKLYFLSGPLSRGDVGAVAEQLLADPVMETAAIDPPIAVPTIEVVPHTGVMDPAAATTARAIRDLGLAIDSVCTGRRYEAAPMAADHDLARVAKHHLANALIEQVHVSQPGDPGVAAPAMHATPGVVGLRHVPLAGAGPEALLALSRDGHLALDSAEMQAIQAAFAAAGRDPTDIELETIAQTWSEHCVHKTLKSAVAYCGPGFPETIDPTGGAALPTIERLYGNLLRDTIAAATRTLDHPWCWSVFEDNAGIIELDHERGVAFKVETHNHPSALEPYGGAATGIGGCIRDIMGCGLGARPIANTTVFCVAPPDLPAERVPAGLFHPRRSLREIVRGVRDYGNRMGIPTVNGAVAFDDRYLGNPLVFCGCVGVIPRNRIAKRVHAGDHIVVVGGRTGRDGIHGATFSSEGMTDTHGTTFAHAVQIGNPITEKQVLDVLLQARDHPSGPLYHAITDCGAGGLSSAVGEMGAAGGARVHLDRVPLKYAGLRYDEIWISEAQERMVLAVPPDRLPELQRLCAAEDVEATAIGTFTDSGRLELVFQETVVGDLDTHFLHEGLPGRQRAATWTQPARRPPSPPPSDLQQALLERLADPNVASKAWITRQYDHEVQGGSVIKPLMGPGRGPTDGAVVQPDPGSGPAVVLSCGLCPDLAAIDPYVMAVAAIDEAVRNNLCVGGTLQRMAILDNFCWGGVSTPAAMGGLVRAAQGCHDGALAYGVPFISGKDSLNNAFDMAASEAERCGWPRRLEIPGTLLISAMSVIDTVSRARTSDLKRPGHHLLLVRPAGRRLADLAVSARALESLIQQPGVHSAHDVSDGGWVVTAAEMVIGSRHGLMLQLAPGGVGPFDVCLGTVLVEVDDATAGWTDPAVVVTPCGRVVDDPQLTVHDAVGRQAVWTADALRAAWSAPLDWPG